MTEFDLLLAQAIERELTARQAGAANQQAEAMQRIRELRTDRRAVSRARREAGRVVLRIDADEVGSEELVASFGLPRDDMHAAASAVWQFLLDLDSRCATCRNIRLADVLQSLEQELRSTPTDEV